MTKTLRFLAAGVIGGWVALCVDLLVADLIVGYGLGVKVEFLLAYAVAGCVAIIIIGPWIRFLPTRAERIGAVFVAIYIPSIFERLYSTLEFRTGVWTAIPAGFAAVLLYLVWAGILLVLARSENRSWALFIAAFSAALGLSLNRNLVDFPLEIQALIIDGSVIAFAVAAVVILRRFDGKTLLVFVLSCSLLAVSVLRMSETRRSHHIDVAGCSSRPLNLLMLVVDTLRADVFEDVLATTVEGRAFAQAFSGSTYFDRAYATSPWTAPSMGSIMTGLYPHEHRFGASTKDPARPLRRLKDSLPTVAEWLRKDGYTTMAFGTNTMLHPASGIDRGFDHYEIVKGVSEKLPLMTVLQRLGFVSLEPYQDSEKLLARFESELDDLVDRKPFFVWLHFMDPHAPLVDHPDLPPDRAGEGLPELDRLYRNEVRYVLSSVNRVAQTLDRVGVWDQTLTVVVSDHGEMLPSDQHEALFRDRRGRQRDYGHGHALFEELVRVPLVVRAGGNWGGIARNSELTSHIDLVPTFAELLGTRMRPEGGEGVSFAPLIGDPGLNIKGRDATFMGALRSGPMQYAMRSGDLKIIHYFDEEHGPRIFDLASDPGEQVNRDRGFSEELERYAPQLRALMDAMAHEVDDSASQLDAATLRQLEALGYVGGS